MRVKCLFLLFLFWMGHPLVFGQTFRMKIPALDGRAYHLDNGSEIFRSEWIGSMRPGDNPEDWGISLQNLTSFYHPTPVPKAEFERLKARANERRREKNLTHKTNDNRAREYTTGDTLGLHLSTHFRGNIRDNSVPMDNTIAVSRNGFIVSAINVNVIFTNPTGEVTFRRGLNDFFKLLNLGSTMYDPRVIYDPEMNRFIFMCLNGVNPNSTYLCLAFSATEDPNGTWNFYKIKGNPSGDNHWFDYPNIAVSAHDFYITGLMRDVQGDWQYSVIYQINKFAGYAGGDLLWKYYDDLRNADGSLAFNPVPSPSGWSSLIDPGMYFVSNEALGGDLYNLYIITESLHNNPQLISLQTRGLRTELAPNGRQKGSNKRLNTFDSRIWSALYLDGVIHIGSHVNTPNGDVGLFYGRIDVENVRVYADILTIPDLDFAFPSFASFGTQESKSEILINYLISGSDIYPSQQQRICTGRFDVFQWGAPITLKEGTDFVDFLTGDSERWGDYTTASRRFGLDRVEVWVAGSFGENQRYGNWIGQYIKKSEMDTKSVIDFVSDKTTTQKNNFIQFRDISTPPPTEWSWEFPGGNPSMSSEQNPVVLYSDNGAYDVQLIIKNDFGYDTLLKPQFVHIVEAVEPPKADFRPEVDTIYTGDSVRYINLSSPNSTVFLWDFFGGIPSISEEREPVVKYQNAGSFLVSLIARNPAGSDKKNKLKAITVIKRSAPKADFTADRVAIMLGDSVMFLDRSTGGPREYEWIFSGGTPMTSTAKNPVIKYEQDGIYSVALKVKNEMGEDFIEKKDFIRVGVSTVKEQTPDVEEVYLFPNPVIDSRLNIKFDKRSTGLLKISLFDISGKLVKVLIHQSVKEGTNLLGFNTDNLSSGQYYVVFEFEKKALSLPFLVTN